MQEIGESRKSEKIANEKIGNWEKQEIRTSRRSKKYENQ